MKPHGINDNNNGHVMLVVTVLILMAMEIVVMGAKVMRIDDSECGW